MFWTPGPNTIKSGRWMRTVEWRIRFA